MAVDEATVEAGIAAAVQRAADANKERRCAPTITPSHTDEGGLKERINGNTDSANFGNIYSLHQS